MARRGNSIIGIDLGKNFFKAVLLQRKTDERFVLTNYVSREVPESFDNPDALAQEIKNLTRELGGSAKSCAVAVSDPTAILRIIEQPETPVNLLRTALRLNGLMVLNQECKDFVLDCAQVTVPAAVTAEAKAGSEGENSGGTAVMNSGAQTRYLVGGMLRTSARQISEACTKARLPADLLQLAPICSFNAFEFAYPETFTKDAFLLLDMGYLQSTVMIGQKRELVLIRSIDYGGKELTRVLTANGTLDNDSARLMLREGDAGMVELCRNSLFRLATEVRNSIGFFEGQHERGINRIFVSGGLARSELVLQTLSDELSLPCEIWDPLETCEVALPPAKSQALPHEFVSLNVACGAALEYLRN